jgi:hypothetical protein
MANRHCHLFFNFQSEELISKTKNIIVIPVSLFLVALLTSFGPWGLYQMSWRSQYSRFESILKKYDMIQNGKLERNKTRFSSDDAFELKKTLSYLVQYHASEKLPDIFSEADRASLTKIAKNKARYTIENDVEAFMRKRFDTPDEINKTSYGQRTSVSQKSINYYNYRQTTELEPNLFYLTLDSSTQSQIEISNTKSILKLTFNRTTLKLVLTKDTHVLLSEDLKPVLDKLKGHQNGDDPLILRFNNSEVAVTFIPNSISRHTESSDYTSMTGVMIVRLLK